MAHLGINSLAAPAPQDSGLRRFGQALQAFSAGGRGEGQEFISGQREQRESLSDERRQAALLDVRSARNLLQQGNVADASRLLQNR